MAIFALSKDQKRKIVIFGLAQYLLLSTEEVNKLHEILA